MKQIGKLITVIVVLALAYFIYSFFTKTSAKYEHYEQAIDSLTQEVKVLDSVHHEQDSIILVYQDSVNYLDNLIDNEHIKIVTVEKKFKEIRNQVHQYHASEIDSFFKSRYNY